MTTKLKITLSIIISLLLSLALVVFLIQPVYQQIQSDSKIYVAQQEELNSLDNKIKNIEEFRKNYSGIKANLQEAAMLFIDSKAPTDFIFFLETISQQSNCLMEIIPSRPVKSSTDKWYSMNFQINSACSFSGFSRFLQKLESGPYLIIINNLQINKLNEADLKKPEFIGFSIQDIQSNISIKVFSSDYENK